MSYNPLSILLPALALWTSAAQAEDQAFEQHDSHVHGQASLMVAIDGNQVELLLESPAYNMVGFEHPPEDDTQRAAVAKAVETLRHAEALFQLNEASHCAVSESDVETPLMHADSEHTEDTEHGRDEKPTDGVQREHEAKHAEDANHEHETEHEGHAEFSGRYRFECAEPAALKEIAVKLFEPFPAVERLTVTVTSDKGQTQVSLTPERNRIPLDTP